MNVIAKIAQQPSRTSRYVAHLDARLVTEAPDQQRKTLLLQLSRWTRAYENFVYALDRGWKSTEGQSLDDYLGPINTIQARLGRLRS